MINAILVFNNSGQPRLTKFYTQLVRLAVPPPSPDPHQVSPSFHQFPTKPGFKLQTKTKNLLPTLGHHHPTIPALPDLHPRLRPPRLSLQLPPPPPAPTIPKQRLLPQ